MSITRSLLSVVLALAVSGGLLAWLLSDEVLEALATSLEQASLWRLGAVLLLVPVIHGFRAWRFWLLLTGRATLPPRPLFWVAVRLAVLNLILPLKLGEFSFPVLMKAALGTDVARSVSVLVLSRIVDLPIVISFLALSTALALPAGVGGWSSAALLALGLGLLVTPLLPVPRLAMVARAERTGDVPHSLLARLAWALAMTRQFRPRAVVFVLTLLIWATHGLIAYLAATAIAPDLRVLQALMAGSAANLAFALPVPTIAGLGPSQAAWATALNLTGAPWPVATVTALVSHGLVLTANITLGALAFVPHPGLRWRAGDGRGSPGTPAECSNAPLAEKPKG